MVKNLIIFRWFFDHKKIKNFLYHLIQIDEKNRIFNSVSKLGPETWILDMYFSKIFRSFFCGLLSNMSFCLWKFEKIFQKYFQEGLANAALEILPDFAFAIPVSLFVANPPAAILWAGWMAVGEWEKLTTFLKIFCKTQPAGLNFLFKKIFFKCLFFDILFITHLNILKAKMTQQTEQQK